MPRWKTTTDEKHLLVESCIRNSWVSFANNCAHKTADVFSSLDATFDWLELKLFLEQLRVVHGVASILEGRFLLESLIDSTIGTELAWGAINRERSSVLSVGATNSNFVETTQSILQFQINSGPWDLFVIWSLRSILTKIILSKG